MNARIQGFQNELTTAERARFEVIAAAKNRTPGAHLKSLLFPNPAPYIAPAYGQGQRGKQKKSS